MDPQQWPKKAGSLEGIKPDDELTWRARIASILEAEPYNHEVYFHEGAHDRKFSVSKSAGFVDLYVRTSPDWPFHDKWPVLGVETKMPRRLGWMLDAIAQVQRYSQAREAIYRIDGRQVPVPSIFLISTPDGWSTGDVYVWNHPRLLTPEHVAGGAIAVTELYDRLLWRAGAAVLRDRHFLTNIGGDHGGNQRYDLYT